MAAVDRLPGRYYSVHDDTMQELADAVRKRTGSWASMTPQQMMDRLNASFFESYDIDPYYGSNAAAWTRPAGWPDLDSLNVEFSGENDVIYMTYDADREVSAVSWHIDTVSGTQAQLDIGHIEAGSFVSDQNFTVNNNTNFCEWLDDYSGYVVVRITGKLTHVYGVNATRDGVTMGHRQQPVLERIAYVPNLVYMNYSTSYSWGLWTLERERIGNGDGAALTSMANMYLECSNLRALDLTGFYTPNVTSMTAVFSGCCLLRALDLRHWVTEKVTNFSSMFATCRGLEILDMRGWDTGRSTTFASMFVDCRRVREFKGIEDFDTAAATTLASMFSTCYAVKELPVDGWDVGNVTTMASMFNACRSLLELDLHSWNVGKVTTFASTFSGCHNLKRVNIHGWTHGTLTTVASMFQDCHSLQEIDLSRIIVTSACTSIYSMFSGCWSIKELAFPAWNVTGLGNGNNTGNSVFANCYSLERITGIKDWDFRFTNSLGSMFSACRSLREVDVSGWNVSYATNLSSMFANCYSLKSLDLSDWNPANSTTFASMFSYCHSLRSIGDISEWDTAKVTTMALMFQDCLSLAECPDISGWDVAKVTTLASMFSGCVSMKEIEITGWTLSACTTIATMFRYCYSLEKVTLTGWSIPKVTSTAPAQFLGDCPNLKDVWIFPIPLNHSYANDRCLTHESLIRIIESLPTVSATKTINLTSTNVSRLSAAEKAVATAKKWTIAN